MTSLWNKGRIERGKDKWIVSNWTRKSKIQETAYVQNLYKRQIGYDFNK